VQAVTDIARQGFALKRLLRLHASRWLWRSVDNRHAALCCAAAAVVHVVIELEEEMLHRPGYVIVRSKYSSL
jgi:hypothetical protein